MSQHTTKQIGHIYDEFAAEYERSMPAAERLFFHGGREWLGGQASGTVLEIAIGSGRNIPHYPPGIHLTGIDASSAMLTMARARATDCGRAVTLVQGDAQALPFPDEAFDTVVICLSLCTIPDDRQAIAEAVRVLRPGGLLLWMEHVGSHLWPVRFIQRLLEPFSVRSHADHLTREPARHLPESDITVEEIKRLRLGAVERLRARKLGKATTTRSAPGEQNRHSP